MLENDVKTNEIMNQEDNNMKDYEVSREVFKTTLARFEDELYNRDYDYDSYVVEDMLKESIESKQELYNLFSKHPNWDEENLIIHFDSDYDREFYHVAIIDFANWLVDLLIENKIITDENSDIIYKKINFIKGIKEQFFNDSMNIDIEEMNKYNPNYHLRNNMKSSKAIGKICREEGWDKLTTEKFLDNGNKDSYDYEYAKMCDNINPIKITRHTCISLNPIDYLLMSNGDKWKSCHNIDEPGCYSAGTTSYMLDEHSFVFYTIDGNYDGNYYSGQKKIQRQMFGYNDEVFIQSRLYPQAMDCGAEHIYDSIRAIVQKVISDCLGKPNLWIKSKTNVNDIVEQGYSAQCYPDWHQNNPGSVHCSISRLKMRTKEMPKIIMGKNTICISCGNKLDSYTDNINCCSSRYVCNNCGDSITSEDDVYYVDCETYCRDCVVYCERCGEFERERDSEIVRIQRRSFVDEVCYCKNCQDEYSGVCEECGERWDWEDMIHTEDDYNYCPDCCSYFICEECGETYSDNQYNETDDGTCLCDACYDEYKEK